MHQRLSRNYDSREFYCTACSAQLFKDIENVRAGHLSHAQMNDELIRAVLTLLESERVRSGSIVVERKKRGKR